MQTTKLHAKLYFFSSKHTFGRLDDGSRHRCKVAENAGNQANFWILENLLAVFECNMSPNRSCIMFSKAHYHVKGEMFLLIC